ncbi:MAG: hypothetical protein ACXWIG_05075 [Caldimonas sp.]
MTPPGGAADARHPSCAITVTRFGAWRVAILIVALAAEAALAIWLATSPLGASVPVRIGIAAAALAVVALAASLLRMPPLTLRWDGREWSVLPVAGSSPGPWAGELRVAIDLGSFLLLRFVPHGRSGPAVARWIPVGRRGQEREWHALRCAVYSPRPAAGSVAADPLSPE